MRKKNIEKGLSAEWEIKKSREKKRGEEKKVCQQCQEEQTNVREKSAESAE